MLEDIQPINPISVIFDTTTVRFAEVNGEVLVSANDVMAQLGYANPRDAWSDMKPKVEFYCGDVGRFPTTASDGKTYQMSFLNRQQLITLLIKSNRPEAKPFFQWALSVLDREINELQAIKHNREIEAAVAKALQPVKDEAYYHQQILDLTNLSSIKFRSEAVFHNTLNTPDGVKHRRTDLIKVNPRNILCYELKAHQINIEDISNTLSVKGYLSLIAQQFPNKCIDFRFISPFGISYSAIRSLELMGAQDKYKEFTVDGINFRAKVSFESTQSLAATIKANILKVTPQRHAWYVEKHIVPNFTDILEHSKVVQFPIKKVAA